MTLQQIKQMQAARKLKVEEESLSFKWGNTGWRLAIVYLLCVPTSVGRVGLYSAISRSSRCRSISSFIFM